MLKNKILGFGFVGAVLVKMAIGVFALDLQAHAAAPTVSTTTTVHAYIIKTKAGFVFKQTTITVALKTPFEFTNDTAVSQTVTSKGKTIVTVAAHSSRPHTLTATGTYVFSLASNTATMLTVTVK
ncbi:MAG TPA: hypothetical protein VIX20_10635 [Ktedonobacteraceae bacterium]